MTNGAKWKDFRLRSLKEVFFELWALVLLGLTPTGFKGWCDLSGAAASAGASSACPQQNLPVITAAPAQDLCELLRMAVASAEEQVPTPRASPLRLLSPSSALIAATSATTCIKGCVVLQLGLTSKALWQNFRLLQREWDAVLNIYQLSFVNMNSTIFVTIRTVFHLSMALFVLALYFTYLLTLLYSAVISSVKLYFNVLIQ